MDSFEPSLRDAISAWQSATEIYADIFESLATATAANPSLGTRDGPGHAKFTEMAKTAQAALSAVKSLTLHEGQHVSDRKAFVMEEEKGNEKSDDADEHCDNDDTNPQARNTDGYGNSCSKVHSSGKRDWILEQHKQRRARKQAKRATRLANAATELAQGLPGSASGESFQQIPVYKNGHSKAEWIQPAVRIEYEDLSAEVAARLKMKEERKAAAKKERKRKRNSEDSVDLAELDDNFERPPKKKSLGDDRAIDADERSMASIKKHLRAEEENLESMQPKKRRKG